MGASWIVAALGRTITRVSYGNVRMQDVSSEILTVICFEITHNTHTKIKKLNSLNFHLHDSHPIFSYQIAGKLWYPQLHVWLSIRVSGSLEYTLFSSSVHYNIETKQNIRVYKESNYEIYNINLYYIFLILGYFSLFLMHNCDCLSLPAWDQYAEAVQTLQHIFKNTYSVHLQSLCLFQYQLNALILWY
jgi:hypothetical protein